VYRLDRRHHAPLPRLAADKFNWVGSWCINRRRGRVDNIHTLVAAHGDDSGCLTFDFAEGERLLVWDPEGVAISDREFRIRQANRIRWEWYFYGRPHTPDNQYVIEHVRTGDDVRASTDVRWAPLPFAPTTTKPAVELLR
jgi:hypothetical protein